ncbi:MAG: hypothetical protein HY327_00280 [Chloroflexi bacterium]|nr:hypothetical protein [Chloroflexota bacterium]
MTTCPNCGSPVTPGLRYCGVCSYDLQAAPASTVPASLPADDEASPYAYSQPYGYFDTQPLPETRGGGRTVMIGIVFILAICLAFACGVLVGDQLPALLKALGFGGAPPTPTPRPSGWIDLLSLWVA